MNAVYEPISGDVILLLYGNVWTYSSTYRDALEDLREMLGEPNAEPTAVYSAHPSVQVLGGVPQTTAARDPVRLR